MGVVPRKISRIITVTQAIEIGGLQNEWDVCLGKDVLRRGRN